MAKKTTKAAAKVRKAAASKPPKAEETALVPVAPPEPEQPTSSELALPAAKPEVIERASIQSLTSVMTTEQLAQAIDTQRDQRALLVQFVREQLVSGVDFGKIHVSKNCPQKWTPKECKVDGHWSKDCLFKAGQEKIFSLLGITSELEKDTETLEMLGNPVGTIAYLCKMYKGDAHLGSGRGSCEVGGALGRDSNSATKIAEKRARMDACLSLGFSEFFTQDMDDPDYRGRDDAPTEASTTSEAPAKKPAEDSAELKAAKKFLTDNHIKNDTMMFAWIKRLLVSYGIETPEMMKATIAANVGDKPGKIEFVELIKRLRAGKFTRAAQTEAAATEPPKDDVVTDVPDEPLTAADFDDAMGGDDNPPMPDDFLKVDEPPTATQEPQEQPEQSGPVQITQQLKDALKMHLDSFGLSSYGMLQFMNNATGRLVITSVRTDEEWRALHHSVMRVLNAEIELPKEWLASTKGGVSANEQQQLTMGNGYIDNDGNVVRLPYNETKEIQETK